MDVLATRDGRPVTGLTRADFVLRDNGVEQQIVSVQHEEIPVTLLLTLDTSESVAGELLERLKSATQAAAAALGPDDRAGLVTFSDAIRLRLAPPAAADALARPVDAIDATGNTRLYDGVFAAMTLRGQSPGRAVLLVFSDGDDTASWLDPRDVLAVAQRTDVVCYGVVRQSASRTVLERVPRRVLSTNAAAALRATREMRLGFDRDPYLYGHMFLPRLAEETGGSILTVTSDDLDRAFVEIVAEFRHRYVVTYMPEGVEAGGWHQLEVRTRQRGVDVRARRGYLR